MQINTNFSVVEVNTRRMLETLFKTNRFVSVKKIDNGKEIESIDSLIDILSFEINLMKKIAFRTGYSNGFEAGEKHATPNGINAAKLKAAFLTGSKYERKKWISYNKCMKNHNCSDCEERIKNVKKEIG